MKVRHVLGISGGKDSAALAIYMKTKYPDLDIDYYTCDTGKELDETYQLIENLEGFLGKKITKLKAVENSHLDPFDYFVKFKGYFLPSSLVRWCTKSLKLEPFERHIGNDPTVSYVGIRGDEEREGYISTKSNIQSIFPFRKNIWSDEVIKKALVNSNVERMLDLFSSIDLENRSARFLELLGQPIKIDFPMHQKHSLLLDLNVRDFNRLVFAFLKDTDYPLSLENQFPLVEDDSNLVRDDIFRLLEESGVGIPDYYKKMPFEVNGEKGEYSRSRSGCYFCFFQQRIEWVWLYEQHPDLFFQAMEYEKDGYTWGQNESLAELIKPERIEQIKMEFIQKTKGIKKQSPFLLDILDEVEEVGCAACFL
ncbi:MAG TPA: phosphoadenosine phosphosulfate reductase family protein [Saprospiraceae bacterium]|nr:phosphoadenosine phosphosulfate reductase family protein [Saprospiraceae bacterium]HMQ81599.1 phosphoadenosine phosphosulfate reductase family protein [Saprospiraceae bacterium]